MSREEPETEDTFPDSPSNAVSNPSRFNVGTLPYLPHADKVVQVQTEVLSEQTKAHMRFLPK